MHDIIHIIGLCPDAASHPDLSDILLYMYNECRYIRLNITNIFKLLYPRSGKI